MAIKYYAGQDVKGTLKVAGVALFDSNVGIGITGPGTKLDVSGQIRSNDSFLLQSGTTAIGSIRNQGGALDIRGDSTRDVSLGSVSYPQALFIEGSNSNVGIGTTSPLTKLHIAGTTDANIIRIENTSTSLSLGSTIGAIQFFNNDSTDDSPNVAASIYATAGASGGSGSLRFKTTEPGVEGDPATDTMIITNGGNVGIGTTSPGAKLNVAGDILINSGEYLSWGTVGSTSIEGSTASNKLQFRTNSSDRMIIDSTGNVGIGTTIPTSPLTIKSNSTSSSSSGLTIQSNGNTNNIFELGEKSTDGARLQMYDAGVAKIALYTDGTNNYINAGNVGIGTDSPGAKLEVEGNSGSGPLFKVEETQATLGTKLATFIQADGTNNPNLDISSTSTGILVNTGFSTGIAGSFTLQSNGGGSYLAFNTNSANERMRITSAGGISFGSTGTAYGTSGQILKSNGNASPTWIDGSAIPGVGTVTGTGTAEYIPKWNSTSALVNSKAFQSTASSITTFNIGIASTTCDFLNFPDGTGAITGKTPIIEAKAALIGIGARDKTYTTIYEGIKIIPATSHYLTRITPRLEVYPYEDPSTTTDNTYDTSFVGSCFTMGSQNTIGNSASSNLGIFGFNNTIAGDKFVIIGQGNVMGKDNVSSLAVGTTNTISGNGKLVNSLLIGQNMTLTQQATRSIVAGINHSFQGAMNNTVIVGSGNQGFGQNNFIWGSSNQGSGVNNIMLGGFSTQITSSSGNLYGSALMGWNNTLQTSPRATFVTGRDNIVVDTDYSIIGGFNNDTDGNNYSLLVGTKNYGRGSGNIIGGESNTVENTSSNNNLIGGFGNTVSSLSNLVVGTNNNVKSTTKGNIVGGNNNNIDVAANENNIISGIGNDIFVGSDNIVAGNGNNIGILSNTSSKIARSIIVGQNNSVGTYSASGVAAKSNMAIFGSSNSARGQNAFVAGSNNSCYTDNAIVLGNGNSAGGVASGESKVIQIGFSISPTSQSDYLAIGYGMSALPTTAVDNNNVANKYTAIGRNPDNNVDYDLSSLDPVSFIVGAGTQQNFRRTAIAVTCKNASGDESNVILPGVGKYRNYTNDTTAAAGGVPLYGLYHTSGTIKIRIA